MNFQLFVREEEIFWHFEEADAGWNQFNFFTKCYWTMTIGLYEFHLRFKLHFMVALIQVETIVRLHRFTSVLIVT